MFLERGLDVGISIERKAQVDVVSDFVGQARLLLETNGVHPGAPCMLIGACLEEYLRSWVEDEQLDIKKANPGIDTYSKALRTASLIGKQELKDIVSWGGLRNHAAHGEWGEVDDKKRISIMLEGVELFIRKHGLNTRQ